MVTLLPHQLSCDRQQPSPTEHDGIILRSNWDNFDLDTIPQLQSLTLILKPLKFGRIKRNRICRQTDAMRGGGKFNKRKRHAAPSEQLQTPEAVAHWRKGDEESSSGDDEEEGEEEVEEKEVKAKGVSHLIETKNPNRTGHSGNIFDESAPMSRREREAMELANMDPLKLKSEEELARDLARLSLIRKEREEAAKKREEERKAKEAERAAAQARAQERLAALQQKGKKKGGGKPKTSTNTGASATSSSTPSVPATES